MQPGKTAKLGEDAKKSGEHALLVRGRARAEASKPSGRGRSPRSACNFCHDKRVKCVMMEGELRCEQCIQRDTNCVFSIKGKTGPKPKLSKSKTDAPRQKGKSSRRLRRSNPLAEEASTLPTKGDSLGFGVDVGAAPVAANTAAAGRERVLLDIYIRTIGKLVPLVEEDVLLETLKERQRLPQTMATVVGVESIACEQAQVVGAISLGALINGDVEVAESYHFSLRYHIGDVLRQTEPKAAPSLGMVALYWQHRGEDELKAEWVGHARRVLGQASEVPIDLILCIEHLDYAREAHVRPGIDTLPPSRRALHSISCLLSNMPIIVNSAVGRATAVAFCDDLSVCIRGLQNETSVELSLLLCTSLRALLLVMLGRRDAAFVVLEAIPPLIDSASGGNPSVVRALPLSWDALLITSTLSFLLGQGENYQRLRAAVEIANNVPPAARWTFCLPEVGSDPKTYVAHECYSSSNICTIMCEIANKTGFGRRPFYPDLQSLPHPPLAVLSPHHQRVASYPSGECSYGYSTESISMSRVPFDERGDGDPFESTAYGDGSGRVAAMNADLAGSTGSGTSKRRRVVEDGETNSNHYSLLPDKRRQYYSPSNSIALAGKDIITAFVAETDQVVGDPVFACKEDYGIVVVGNGFCEEDDGLGLTRGLHNMSLSRLSVPLLPGGGVAPVGLQDDHGPLGRVPSEGLMDLGSTLGSFAMDIAGTGEGDGDCGIHSGDETGANNVGNMTLDGRRSSQRQLSSFPTYSTSPCRSGSMPRDRQSSAGGESIGQCSDLGHDVFVAAENFMDEEGNHDICGNILGVDAILSDICGSVDTVVETEKRGGVWDGVEVGVGGGINNAGGHQSESEASLSIRGM